VGQERGICLPIRLRGGPAKTLHAFGASPMLNSRDLSWCDEPCQNQMVSVGSGRLATFAVAIWSQLRLFDWHSTLQFIEEVVQESGVGEFLLRSFNLYRKQHTKALAAGALVRPGIELNEILDLDVAPTVASIQGVKLAETLKQSVRMRPRLASSLSV
jgi:hypothetical protein